jgi:hypothetical protein
MCCIGSAMEHCGQRDVQWANRDSRSQMTRQSPTKLAGRWTADDPIEAIHHDEFNSIRPDASAAHLIVQPVEFCERVIRRRMIFTHDGRVSSPCVSCACEELLMASVRSRPHGWTMRYGAPEGIRHRGSLPGRQLHSHLARRPHVRRGHRIRCSFPTPSSPVPG